MHEDAAPVTKRVLLDENVPRQLGAALQAGGFPTMRYPNAWKQTKNGELLRRTGDQGFDVLVTNDRNMYAQQNLRALRIAIVVLPTNLRRHVLDRAVDIADTIQRIERGQYVVIEVRGTRRGVDYNTEPPGVVEMPTLDPFKVG
jgi:hypothetical protein